ncbi:MAG: prephenate dehydratase [Mucinivorans sp.]
MEKLRVAIQGIEGCFHHVAATNYFGHRDLEIIECPTFRATARELECQGADVAVMAIENSIAGSILPNYNILQNSALKVVGETNLYIKQNLLVLPDATLEDIREVQSHPIALQQCLDYLDNFPQWRQVSTQDTAFSAREVARMGDKAVAAIAGDLPAQLWGLKIIEPEINTIKNNYTRFLVLTRRDDNRWNSKDIDKASLHFKVSHQRGSLGRVLKCMELYEMNMTKLQSYPIPSDPFRYIFHLDMEFSSVEQYRAAIQLMSHHSQELTIYGEYLSYK